MNNNAPGGRARNLLFTCPTTSQKVQHRLEATSDYNYESVTCLACAGIHFIDPRTGKVLQGDRE